MHDWASTRERIAQMALELFSRSSYAGVTLREVAEASGVSEAVVRHHFATKDALLAEVLQPFLDAMDEAIDGATAREEAVGPLLRSYLAVLLDHRPAARVLWSDRAVRATAPGMRAAEQQRRIVSSLAGPRADRERLIRIHSSLAILRLAATELVAVDPRHLGGTLLQISCEAYAGSR
ncbi:MAG TPA: helix-turn-helix domain-containing protein [Acidimicrobiales bacterium]|nr:helix-turn-helix domain-containing protein [Acidimicrobiales bacterium]